MEWREPTLEQQWEDGTQILAAVRVVSRTKREYWEYAVVTVEADEGHFALVCNNERWGWDYSDIEKFVVLSGRDFTDQALIEQAEREISDYDYWNRSLTPKTFRELLSRFKRIIEEKP